MENQAGDLPFILIVYQRTHRHLLQENRAMQVANDAECFCPSALLLPSIFFTCVLGLVYISRSVIDAREDGTGTREPGSVVENDEDDHDEYESQDEPDGATTSQSRQSAQPNRGQRRERHGTLLNTPDESAQIANGPQFQSLVYPVRTWYLASRYLYSMCTLLAAMIVLAMGISELAAWQDRQRIGAPSRASADTCPESCSVNYTLAQHGVALAAWLAGLHISRQKLDTGVVRVKRAVSNILTFWVLALTYNVIERVLHNASCHSFSGIALCTPPPEWSQVLEYLMILLCLLGVFFSTLLCVRAFSRRPEHQLYEPVPSDTLISPLSSGHQGSGARPKKSKKADDAKPKAPKDLREVLVQIRRLVPFMWPRGNKALQALIALCYLLLFIGRIINILVPIQYRRVVDALTVIAQPVNGTISESIFYVPMRLAHVPAGEMLNSDAAKFAIQHVLIYVFLRFLQGTVTTTLDYSWVPIGQV